MTHADTQTNVTEVSERLLTQARESSSGKAAISVYGGSENILRQTLIALQGGNELPEHDNPGEATVLVLQGGVELIAGDQKTSAQAGDLIHVPQERHSLLAVSDAVVILTTVLK